VLMWKYIEVKCNCQVLLYAVRRTKDCDPKDEDVKSNTDTEHVDDGTNSTY